VRIIETKSEKVLRGPGKGEKEQNVAGDFAIAE
jgi:hypothetical protein